MIARKEAERERERYIAVQDQIDQHNLHPPLLTTTGYLLLVPFYYRPSIQVARAVIPTCRYKKGKEKEKEKKKKGHHHNHTPSKRFNFPAQRPNTLFARQIRYIILTISSAISGLIHHPIDSLTEQRLT